MTMVEETIDATLDANGHLQLSSQPQLPAGLVRVTIRAVSSAGSERGLAGDGLRVGLMCSDSGPVSECRRRGRELKQNPDEFWQPCRLLWNCAAKGLGNS